MTEVDCVVIGAGVVGLAVARALQAAGRQVVVLDKQQTFGTGTSSRNSEVIHAGLYYVPESIKAKTCVRGKQLLYEYCAKRHIPHRRLGKLIVAVTDDEIAILEKYAATARSNGVEDLRWVEKEELRGVEPELVCVRGLLSPSTGIIDSHCYMQSLLGDFEDNGGFFVRKTSVVSGRRVSNGLELEIDDGRRATITAQTVVNSAGLYAPGLALEMEGVVPETVPTPHFAIGHYYALAGGSPFQRLVYPVAANGGLGVHVTLDMAGSARFGPDVRWRDQIDYSFDDTKKEDFIEAIQKYYPGVRERSLLPAYTGIRPKVSRPGQASQDFIVQGDEIHGIRGLINLFGIESPGLTASLAISEMVVSIADNS